MSNPAVPNNIPAMPDILTTTELAKVLNVSHGTAHRYVQSGIIPSFRVGNRYRIRKADVIEYLQKLPLKNQTDYNLQELAEVLGVSEHTAYNLVRQGKIRSFREGYHHRVSREAVEEYLQNSPASLNRTNYRVKDLPAILGVSYKTAYRYVESGKIRSIRVGSSYRIPKIAVDEFLRQSKKPKKQPSQPKYTDGMLSVAEVAEILNLSYQSTLNRVSSGCIRSVKPHGRYRIPKDAVNDYLKGIPVVPEEQIEDSLTLKELTEVLGVSPTSAYNLVFKKRIPSFRVKNQYRITRQAVDDYLSTLEVAPSQPEGHISVNEMMEILGLNKHHTYRLVWSGEIPSTKIGNKYWVPRAAVEEHKKRMDMAASESPQCP